MIRSCERLTIAQIAAARADVVERARAGRLQPTDFEDGTFTISNLGMYGVEQFMAVLNPPQVGILAVGAIQDQVVAEGGEVVIRPRMEISLSATIARSTVRRAPTSCGRCATCSRIRSSRCRPVPFQLDTSTPFGARAARRLDVEAIAWLTTVSAAGGPVPVPVWFLWDGETFLVYSRPDQPKLANLERSPRVTLHLDGDGRGGDVVVVSGRARLALDEPPADRVPPYVEKYAWGFQRIGMTAAEFAATYSGPPADRPGRAPRSLSPVPRSLPGPGSVASPWTAAATACESRRRFDGV